MPLDSAYLREQYASLRLDQLQRLRNEEFAQLAPEAQQLLCAELDQRRAANPPPPYLGQPCPAHPEAAIAAVCARCGKFLCAKCVADPHEGSVCPECQARIDSVPLRFNLWTGLAFANLLSYPFLILPAQVVAVSDTLATGFSHLVNRPSLLIVTFEATLALALTCFSLSIIPAYWKKRRSVPKRMVFFFALATADVLINYALALRLPSHHGGFPAVSLVTTSAIGGLWIRYFASSERVRRTFIT